MIIVPAILESYKSLVDKSYKITLATGELTPEQVANIAAHIQTFGWMAFKQDRFKTQETEVIDSLKSDYEDKGKSHSKRMAAVLYRNWENEPEGFKTARDHYEHHMERMINHWKNKLP